MIILKNRRLINILTLFHLCVCENGTPCVSEVSFTRVTYATSAEQQCAFDAVIDDETGAKYGGCVADRQWLGHILLTLCPGRE